MHRVTLVSVYHILGWWKDFKVLCSPVWKIFSVEITCYVYACFRVCTCTVAKTEGLLLIEVEFKHRTIEILQLAIIELTLLNGDVRVHL